MSRTVMSRTALLSARRCDCLAQQLGKPAKPGGPRSPLRHRLSSSTLKVLPPGLPAEETMQHLQTSISQLELSWTWFYMAPGSLSRVRRILSELCIQTNYCPRTTHWPERTRIALTWKNNWYHKMSCLQAWMAFEIQSNALGSKYCPQTYQRLSSGESGRYLNQYP